MAVWDIARQPAREQFGYWHDVICQVFVPLTPERTVSAEGFAGLVEARPLDTVNRARIRSQPQRTLHGPKEVGRSEGAFYFVNLQLAGRCLTRQGGHESIVEPGQFTVVDTTEPYYFDFDSRWRMLSFRVPREQISARLADPRHGTGVGIDGGRGVGAVAATLMRSLWELDEPAARPALGELERSFASVVAVAMGAAAPRDESLHDGLRVCVLRYVADHLGDPGLSVTAVCRRFAISPRLLHKLFEGREQTFAETVRTLRLRRTAHLLADPGRTETITEVALRHGFTDPASFSRAFRRQFGVAPRDYWAAHGEPASEDGAPTHPAPTHPAAPRKPADGS
jgi:AraC family transcriptional regulator, positive regulator of tynA and feaB